ncbi:MAG: four helix bundle protein [Ignavibacteriaceae bacterium]|nr:four helix bundle protein [Ignavibacteriaceae bacterium]
MTKKVRANKKVRSIMKNKSLKASHELAMSVYKYTQHFPQEEANGLTLQLRNIAVGIPESIAEGLGRMYDAELGLFLSASLGLVSKLAYVVELSFQLGYLEESELDGLEEKIEEVKLLLNASIQKIAA